MWWDGVWSASSAGQEGSSGRGQVLQGSFPMDVTRKIRTKADLRVTCPYCRFYGILDIFGDISLLIQSSAKIGLEWSVWYTPRKSNVPVS